MPHVLFSLHRDLGYLVLLVVAARLAVVLTGPGGRPRARWLGTVAAGLLDLQVLVGILTFIALQGASGAVHPVLMIIAAGLAHAGEGRLRAGRNSVAFHTLSFVLVLAGIIVVRAR